jgi:hypothetical protein
MWHSKSPFHDGFTMRNDSYAPSFHVAATSSPFSYHLRVGPTRQGRLQPFVYAAGIRCSVEAPLPPLPFLLPFSLWDGNGLEAEKAGRSELRPRGRWDQAPPRSAARSVGYSSPEVGGATGGVVFPRGRRATGGVSFPKDSGTVGGVELPRGGGWPVGLAGASSPDGSGARLCPRQHGTSDLRRRGAPWWPSSAMTGRSEVEEGPNVWVPHASCLREGKIRGTRVISHHRSSVEP